MLPNSESKKKNPLDIFNGTSAAMGSSPFPVPKSYANKPSSVNPTPSPMPARNGKSFATNLGMLFGKVNDESIKNFNQNFNNAAKPVLNSVNAVANPVRDFRRSIQGQPETKANAFQPFPIAPRQAPVAQNVGSVAAPVVADSGMTGVQRPVIGGNLAAPIIEPGSVAASVSASGNPMYDNSSIAQLNARNGNVINPAEQPFTRAALDKPAQFSGSASANNANAQQIGAYRIARADALEGLPPDEIRRRMDNAAGGYRGTPGARNAIIASYAAALDGGRQAGKQYQDGANEAFTRGQTGDIQGGLAQQQNKGQAIAQDLLQQGQERIARFQRQPTALADGTLAQIEGNNASTVMGADGKPVKALLQRTEKSGEITPALKYKTLSDDIARISEDVTMAPEERAAAVAPLLQERAALEGGQAQAAPLSLKDFSAAIKAKGSKMTDADIAEYYKQNYGR